MKNARNFMNINTLVCPHCPEKERLQGKEDMKFFLGYELISYSKPGIILVCYIVLASYLCIAECSISLPKDAKVPALLVFGDSIVDTGNNNYLATPWKANFPPYGRDFYGGVPTGRFSNGKVPSDLIAEEIGIKELVPPYLNPTLQISDLLTGVSFASGTSGYDPYSAKSGNVMTLQDQLKLFRSYIKELRAAVGNKTTRYIISRSVYLVCSGSNDITNAYFNSPFRRLNYTISSYADFIVHSASTFIQELYKLGARRIGVCSAPPCGCLPSQRTLKGDLLRQCSDEENRAALLFNQKLNGELGSLKRKLSGSRIVYLDLYNPMLDIITNASQYGFEVVDRGCCGTGLIEASALCTQFNPGTCKDTSRYFFWDSYHPTETAYRILVGEIIGKSIGEFF